MHIKGITAIAAAFTMAAGLASAAVQPSPTLVDLPLPLITFSGLTSGYNDPTVPYIEDGFAFNPTSFQGGNCAPGPTPSDPCTKETAQTGVVSTMTVNGGGLFSLTSFMFDLQGTGQGPNQLIVTSSKTTNATKLIFQIDQYAPTGVQLYDHYDWPDGAASTRTVGAVYNGTIVNNDTYLALFDLPEFTDVSFVTFSTYQAQNLRIDDINATLTAVPVPASALLLLAGLGGLAAMRRRKSARVPSGTFRFGPSPGAAHFQCRSAARDRGGDSLLQAISSQFETKTGHYRVLRDNEPPAHAFRVCSMTRDTTPGCQMRPWLRILF